MSGVFLQSIKLIKLTLLVGKSWHSSIASLCLPIFTDEVPFLENTETTDMINVFLLLHVVVSPTWQAATSPVCITPRNVRLTNLQAIKSWQTI